MKRYLITGASRGIGCAMAEKLAAPDTTLLLHGRDTIALADVCKTVEPRCASVVYQNVKRIVANLGHQI